MKLELSRENEANKETPKTPPEISLWFYRHYQPSMGYVGPTEMDLHVAKRQAAESAQRFAANLKTGETVIYYGAGTHPRHQKSLELFINAVGRELRKQRKQLNVVNQEKKIRPSQKPVEFNKFRQLLPDRVGQEYEAWWSGVTLNGNIESREHVVHRINSFIIKLIPLSRRLDCRGKINWVMFTSGEVMSSWFANQFRIDDIYNGFTPGSWLRIDIPESSFEGHVRVITYSGLQLNTEISHPLV